MTARMLPDQCILEVEQYVEQQLDAAARFENREPLDESGVWSLHALAASLYAAGWEAGERAESARRDGERRRTRESV